MTAHQELCEISAAFKVCEPEFKIKLSNDNKRITIEVEGSHDPASDIVGNTDPVVLILATLYRERFDTDVLKMKAYVNVEEAFAKILRSVTDFYYTTSPLKQPGNSHLGKWLRNMQGEYHYEFSTGFLSLYRYIHSMSYTSKKDPNVLNVHEILQLMMEKYDR